MKQYNKHNINGSRFYKLRGKIYCHSHNRELDLITSLREYMLKNPPGDDDDDGYTCDQCDVDSDVYDQFPPTYNCSDCELDVCHKCINNPAKFMQ